MRRVPFVLVFLALVIVPVAARAQEKDLESGDEADEATSAPPSVPTTPGVEDFRRAPLQSLKKLWRDGLDTIPPALDDPRVALEQLQGQFEDTRAQIRERLEDVSRQAEARLQPVADRLDQAWPVEKRGPLVSDESFIPRQVREPVNRDFEGQSSNWRLGADLSGLEVTILEADLDFHDIARKLSRLDLKGIEYEFVLVRVKGLQIEGRGERAWWLSLDGRAAALLLDVSLGKAEGDLGIVGRAEFIAGEVEGGATLGILELEGEAGFGYGAFFDFDPTRWFRWLKTGVRVGPQVGWGVKLKLPKLGF